MLIFERESVLLLAVILLAALCVVLLLRIYALERNLRQGAQQLKARKAEGDRPPSALPHPIWLQRN